MTFLSRRRAAWHYSRFMPWVESPEWTQADAQGLQQYLKSASGTKLKQYMVNLILRKQAQALSSTSNLKYSAGLCNGSKAILTQLDSLAEPENFTAEDAATPEVS